MRREGKETQDGTHMKKVLIVVIIIIIGYAYFHNKNNTSTTAGQVSVSEP
jgi:hypothetical protein